MSENNGNVLHKVEENLKKHLSGDALKNALDYVNFLDSNGIYPDFTDNGVHLFKYKDECVSLIGTPPFWDVVGWNIYGFNNNTMCDDFPVDEELINFAWTHVKPCEVAIGGNCGGDCKPGVCADVFGKDFEGTCCHVTKFENPDTDAMKNIVKLTQVWKHCIDEKN